MNDTLVTTLALTIASVAEDEHHEIKVQCQLLGEFGSFGWWVQVFLFVTCFCSLIYKRFYDEVRRAWLVWFFDTSKQGFGAMLAHSLNLALAKVLNFLVSVDADACNWYFINITMDTSFGCIIVVFLVKILKYFYRVYLKRPDLARLGEYGNPPSFKIWRRQLFDYMVITVVEKFLMIIAVVVFSPTLTAVVGILLGLFNNFPQVKLTIVMVIWPIICSVGYFWIVDNFLKAEDARILVEPDEVEPQRRSSDSSFFLDSILDDDICTFEEWNSRIPRKPMETQRDK